MPAATLVACTRSMTRASTARSIRPPSIGKAGMMLKSTKMRFASRSWVQKLLAIKSGVIGWAKKPVTARPREMTPASKTLTSGPAAATRNSLPGSSGMWSTRASPPMGSRVMSLVGMPKRRAISACPSSCRMTNRNNARMIAKFIRMVWGGSPAARPEIPTPNSRMKNVRWILRSIPAILPIFKDHFIKFTSQLRFIF